MLGVSQYYFFLTQLVAPIRTPLSDLSYDIQTVLQFPSSPP